MANNRSACVCVCVNFSSDHRDSIGIVVGVDDSQKKIDHSCNRVCTAVPRRRGFFSRNPGAVDKAKQMPLVYRWYIYQYMV